MSAAAVALGILWAALKVGLPAFLALILLSREYDLPGPPPKWLDVLFPVVYFTVAAAALTGVLAFWGWVVLSVARL